MNKMPYSLAFDLKVVISLEVELPTILTEAYGNDHNDEVISQDLDLIEEKKENTLIRMANY